MARRNRIRFVRIATHLDRPGQPGPSPRLGGNFFGGAVAALPVFFTITRPGEAITRHTIAVGQMVTSALLIHLSGGRIETHFHVFGSLAFLAFYRDWRVMVTGTVVVALDHFLRGVYWPQSVFGVLTASYWRWMEHAAWVLFEDVFLVMAILQSRREMRSIALNRAELEKTNAEVESKIARRTTQLTVAHHERNFHYHFAVFANNRVARRNV